MEEGLRLMRREIQIAKANRSLWRVIGMGMLHEGMTMEAARGMYETFVRPVYEYAGEVGAEKWKEIEVFHRYAGRLILGVSQATANEVVQGELGWWTVGARFDYLRLVYYGKLCSEQMHMPSHISKLVAGVFRESRARAKEGNKKVWCAYTCQLMCSLGLKEEWQTGQVGELHVWRKRLWERLQDREWRK